MKFDWLRGFTRDLFQTHIPQRLKEDVMELPEPAQNNSVSSNFDEPLKFASGFWLFAAMLGQWIFAASIFACRG